MNISEQIWREHHGKLRNFIRSKVTDDDDTNDILQDVFLKMHTALPSLNDRTKLTSWLYQITRNTITDFYRSRRSMDAVPDDLPEPESDPGAEVLQEMASCMLPMMHVLPQPYRDAVYLSEIEGLSQAEIAENLNITLTAAKSRVRRGRVKVKEMLDLCCEFEFDQAGRLSEYTPRRKKCDSNC